MTAQLKSRGIRGHSGGKGKLRAGVILLVGCALLAACQPPAQESSGQAVTATTPTQQKEARVTPAPQEVTFSTSDDIQLSGTLYKGSSTAVVFSHMSHGSRADWRDVPELLAARGFSVLAFDFRGRGQSEGSFDPATAADDLLAAVAYMEAAGAEQLALAGASMGAMASAKVAALKPTKALVLVAGTTSWRGLTVSDDELTAIKSPLLVITSEHDLYAEGTLHLHDAAGGPKDKHIYEGAAHGTDLFDDYGEDLRSRIIDFIISNTTLD